MRSVSLIPVWIYAVSRSLAKAAKVLVADSWLMEHSYTRYNAVHSDFTKKGGPARHQARRWVLKLLGLDAEVRSEEHTSELQSLMRISYAVFCLKKKKDQKHTKTKKNKTRKTQKEYTPSQQ